MISRLHLAAFLFSMPLLLSGAQAPAQFTADFAPSEPWVKPSEQPYRQSICLNGLWQFQPVALPKDFKEGYDPTPDLPKPSGQWDRVPIRIPSPWNVNSYADVNGVGGDFRCFPSYPKEWESTKMGWLQKTFVVPADWSGKRILLRFSAVAGEAQISVNGKSVGNHFKLFLPIEVDITDAVVRGGQNTLLVGVRKASLFDSRGKIGRRPYQGGSFWGPHIAGIWDDVHLIAVPALRVSDVYVKPLLDQDTLEAEVTLRNDTQAEVRATVGAEVHPWISKAGKDVLSAPLPSSEVGRESVLEVPAAEVSIAPGQEAKVVLRSPVNDRLKRWSPQEPNLYGLLAQVRTNDAPVDSKYTRFGWRQFTLQGSQYLLNGQPLVFNGDSWHFMGIPQMTRRYAWAWFKAMRDANLNTVRLHANPYPSFYLDVADEMGVLVLDESAVYASGGGLKMDSEAFWQDSLTHIKDLVLRDRNHASVFGWSVSNEVLPVVTDLYHSPPGIKEKLTEYYGKWADICRQLDPTRPWISADGEKDGEGKLPTYIVHYEGPIGMEKARKSGKPWGMGETGYAYYGTPEEVSAINGNRAYESFLGRMEGIAISSYESLMTQRKYDAIYRSIFNMVWYGLKPLPLGLRDTTRPPTLEDGIFFPRFEEGKPGVQPERLGPYCSTLNPGYTEELPLYEPWPLFDAIRAACAEPPQPFQIPSKPKQPSQISPAAQKVSKLLAGKGSTMEQELTKTGVSLKNQAEVPQVLFIDGANPPGKEARRTLEKVLKANGTVMVMGIAPGKLKELNALLPAELEVTKRSASSLLPQGQSSLIAGLSAADLYYSELVPPQIVSHCLGGPLVQQSEVLLQACDTDWLLWNKQREEAKTIMVLRSEREAKPSGAVLISKKMGEGTLIATTLPAAPRLVEHEKTVRALLGNLGLALGPGRDSGKALSADGEINRLLLCASFPAATLQDGVAQKLVDPAAGESIRVDTKTGEKPWKITALNDKRIIDLVRVPFSGPKQNATAYMSFWVSSPQDLDDLLVRPGLPRVGMEISADDAVQVWLNGQMVLENLRTGLRDENPASVHALKLKQGWNHVLVKLIQGSGGWHWRFSGRLTSDQPEFLAKLGSALEKP